jgi:hypothetical protein
MSLDDDMLAHEAARKIQTGAGPVCVFASILPGQHEWIRALKYDVVQTLKGMSAEARVHLEIRLNASGEPWFYLSQAYEE